jgi:hypothetical protein
MASGGRTRRQGIQSRGQEFRAPARPAVKCAGGAQPVFGPRQPEPLRAAWHGSSRKTSPCGLSSPGFSANRGKHMRTRPFLFQKSTGPEPRFKNGPGVCTKSAIHPWPIRLALAIQKGKSIAASRLKRLHLRRFAPRLDVIPPKSYSQSRPLFGRRSRFSLRSRHKQS